MNSRRTVSALALPVLLVGAGREARRGRPRAAFAAQIVALSAQLQYGPDRGCIAGALARQR